MKKFDKVIQKIREHDSILIFHHKFPDLDTLGAQYGLGEWIRNNFPTKEILLVDIKQENILPSFSNSTKISFKKTLGVIVDVNNTSRVEDTNNLLSKCNYLLCIDHHDSTPSSDLNMTYIDIGSPATCQLLASSFTSIEKKYEYSTKTANYLFFGLITDTNRFLNPNTNIQSHKIISDMYKKNVPVYDNYLMIYKRTLNEAKLYGHITANFIKKNRFAYYILTDKILKKYSVPFAVGKSFVNAMRGIEDIDVFMLITEDDNEKLYSISIRSIYKPINKIAEAYSGGGHKNAAGIKLSYENKKTLQEIINRFNDYANN